MNRLALALALVLAASPALAACPPSVEGRYVVVIEGLGVCDLTIDGGGNVGGSCNPADASISVVRGPSGGLALDATTCRATGDLSLSVSEDIGANQHVERDYRPDVVLWPVAGSWTGYAVQFDGPRRRVTKLELIKVEP